MVAELLVKRETDDCNERVINGGATMLRLLKSNNFDVTAACMIRRSESGIWYLYIVSKIVEEKGPLDSSRELLRLIRPSFPATFSEFEVILLNESEPLAGKIVEWVRDRPGRLFALSNTSDFPLMDIDEVYPYPPEDWGRLAVTVNYHRTGKTNLWTARLEEKGFHEGMKAKGAISYFTTRWEGEAEGDEMLASVHVLVEIDPQLVRTNSLHNPAIHKLLIDQARAMANESFLSKHPDAKIEYNDSETNSQL